MKLESPCIVLVLVAAVFLVSLVLLFPLRRRQKCHYGDRIRGTSAQQKPVTIFMMRHGEGQHNVSSPLCKASFQSGRFIGDVRDPALTETGKFQVSEAGRCVKAYLKGKNPRHVFTSWLLRAMGTGALAFPDTDITVVDYISEKGYPDNPTSRPDPPSEQLNSMMTEKKVNYCPDGAVAYTREQAAVHQWWAIDSPRTNFQSGIPKDYANVHEPNWGSFCAWLTAQTHSDPLNPFQDVDDGYFCVCSHGAFMKDVLNLKTDLANAETWVVDMPAHYDERNILVFDPVSPVNLRKIFDGKTCSS
jgi:broad specificity phosphatase PhoE